MQWCNYIFLNYLIFKRDYFDMMAVVQFLVSYLLFAMSYNEAARILAVFPTPSISHQVVFRPLILELTKRGHHVTVITTDPVYPKEEIFANLTEIDVHDISYKIWKEEVDKTTTGKKDDIFTQLNTFMNVIITVLEKQMQIKEIKDLVNSEQKFDLLLLELWVRPALGFSHIFKVPTILVSSFGNILNSNEIIGAPSHPILYPYVFRQKINNLSMWEKLIELYNQYKLESLQNGVLKKEQEALRRIFAADVPPYKELFDNVQMLFLNVHPIWENNRPVPPSVVFMGGIHHKPKKDLPKDLEEYLNSSRNGVIYISFGTNVMPSLLPPERIQILINVFSQLPYDVLWKYDKDELPGKSENIKISKWLPQSDLLRHPKVKLFITQGGLQSTDEAILAGVPLIGIPLLGDQWYNVEQYVRHKIGVRLDMESLTEDVFRSAIETVIRDKSYKNNVEKLRTLMYDQPQTPLDRAVWWTEHVLRHGGAKHLRSPAANISWAEYLELNLVGTLLLGAVLFITLVVLCTYYSFRVITKYFFKNIKIKIK